MPAIVQTVLISGAVAGLCTYALTARANGAGWALARFVSVTLSTAGVFALGVLPFLGQGTNPPAGDHVYELAYDALVRLGPIGVGVWIVVFAFLLRMVELHWRLYRVGVVGGLTELEERSSEVRRLHDEIRTHRVWIAARMGQTFATKGDADKAIREMRSRQQQIEQAQAKVSDLQVAMGASIGQVKSPRPTP